MSKRKSASAAMLNNRRKRAILYARVSSDEQAKNYSLDSQIEACKKYALQHGYVVVAEERDDISGAKPMGERPGGLRVLDLINRRAADAVIVYQIDRLSRDLIHFLTLRRDWQDAGIELHYCTMGQSQDTSEGGLLETILGVLAQEERKKIRERTMRGRYAKARSGKWVGNGYLPYGYRREGVRQDARLAVDKEQAVVVRDIFKWYVGTDKERPLSLGSIASQLTKRGIASPGNGRGWYIEVLRRMLKYTGYIGVFTYGLGEIRIDLPALAIIDVATFQVAQLRSQRNRELAKRNRKHEYLLSGHFRCVCGAAMSGHMKHDKARYRCYNRLRHEPYLRTCEEPEFFAALADGPVWNWLHDLLSDEARINEGLKAMVAHREGQLAESLNRIASLDKSIDKIEYKIKRLMSAFGDETSETVLMALQDEIKETAKQKDALTQERAQLKSYLTQNELTINIQKAIQTRVAKIRKMLDNATFEDKRHLLDVLDVRVQLQRHGKKRFLKVTCGIAPDAKMGGSIESHAIDSASPSRANTCSGAWDRPNSRRGKDTNKMTSVAYRLKATFAGDSDPRVISLF